MKFFCYLVLIVAFMMYYQQNPVYTIVIIAIGIGLYIFFKARKGKGGTLSKFFGGTNSEADDRVDDLITLFILQQMFNSSSQNQNREQNDKNKSEYKQELEKSKQEILDLLDRD